MHKLKIVDDDDAAENYFHVGVLNTIGIIRFHGITHIYQQVVWKNTSEQ